MLQALFFNTEDYDVHSHGPVSIVQVLQTGCRAHTWKQTACAKTEEQTEGTNNQHQKSPEIWGKYMGTLHIFVSPLAHDLLNC